ncbi:MAG: hypothetical protein IJT47_01025 [Selenomonadaceae bacterium]|nr:hypothetical protein [Selenomonadaceae bacterium]
MAEYKCPKCGSENIQKCEVIYMSGTVSHSSTTTLGRYEATTEGSSSTDLAQAVAPPAEQDTSWLAVIIFGFLAYCFLDESLIVSAILGAIAFLLGKSSVDASEYNDKIYPKEYDRWRHSYICHRCGNRFIIR